MCTIINLYSIYCCIKKYSCTYILYSLTMYIIYFIRCIRYCWFLQVNKLRKHNLLIQYIMFGIKRNHHNCNIPRQTMGGISYVFRCEWPEGSKRTHVQSGSSQLLGFSRDCQEFYLLYYTQDGRVLFTIIYLPDGFCLQYIGIGLS